jgi:hypothetical protein
MTVAILATVTGVFVARSAFAKIVSNTIEPVGIVTDKGRGVDVTGPLAVTAGERVALRVTVTQRTTGAVAEGEVSFTGTGTTNQWQVHATTVGKAVFASGPATATAIATTTAKGGVTTDAHQWLVNITLVSE